MNISQVFVLTFVNFFLMRKKQELLQFKLNKKHRLVHIFFCENDILLSSVADPGCLSRIPDPDFTHPGSQVPDPGSRIPDPKTATKERGEKLWSILVL
jgi:hypothetical protein